jgi:hypothetical protein
MTSNKEQKMRDAPCFRAHGAYANMEPAHLDSWCWLLWVNCGYCNCRQHLARNRSLTMLKPIPTVRERIIACGLIIGLSHMSLISSPSLIFLQLSFRMIPSIAVISISRVGRVACS